MAHHMYENDNAIYVKEAAWHGLGIVVPETMSPTEGLRHAGLDWEVDQIPMFAQDGTGERFDVDTHLLNVRRDIGLPMGVVGAGYRVIQNLELAQFAEALGTVGQDVKIETMGTLFNGKKIYMLLRGESFILPGQDEIIPYFLLRNGHDGSTLCRGQFTTVRVVCKNTWDAADAETSNREAGFAIRHTGNIMSKLVEAKACIERFRAGRELAQDHAQQLVQRELTKTEVAKFFTDLYTAEFGDIPSRNTQLTAAEERARGRAVNAWELFSRRFNEETTLSGSNLWIACNAWTGYLQHDMKVRANEAYRSDRRVDSNLFGLNAQRTRTAFGYALTMAS